MHAAEQYNGNCISFTIVASKLLHNDQHYYKLGAARPDTKASMNQYHG